MMEEEAKEEVKEHEEKDKEDRDEVKEDERGRKIETDIKGKGTKREKDGDH